MPEKVHYTVIAGRLADTKQVSGSQLSKIPDLIRNSFRAVNRVIDRDERLNYEIIRMDDFLAIYDDPVGSINVILLLMSAFRYLSYNALGKRIELKISAGIGPIEFLQEQLRESDGTAFRFAIDGLTSMKRSQRLLITTTNPVINEEFFITCSFMDILIHDWSDEQAEALFLSLTGKNQVEISKQLKISQPAVNRRLKAAHYEATDRFIKRFKKLLS